jgi:signal transduction histidine kinase
MSKVTFKLIKFAWTIFKAGMKLVLVLFGGEILIRKQAEARMRAIARQESQSRMNEFLSVISHDIKTPLTSIKGNIQLVGRRLRSTTTTQPDDMQHLLTETRELLDRADQQLNRLTRLVNGLLESSRISANTMDLLFELCELNLLMNEALQSTHSLPEERTVKVDLPRDKTILVMADASRIKQVLYQYISNAHKYSELGKVIHVSLHEDGSLAHVRVHDEGSGIPAHEHKRIWERYYRVPGTTVLNGSEVGLGLGLYISRTIIEQHHGKVGLKSTSGEGSTFWFTLPLAEQSLNDL